MFSKNLPESLFYRFFSGCWRFLIFQLGRKSLILGSFSTILMLVPVVIESSGSKVLAQSVMTQDLDAASFYQQGVMRFNRKDYVGAEEAFRAALQRDPSLALARNFLGNILLEQNRPEAAIQEYAEAIRLNPNLADAYYNLGLGMHRQGQREAAINAYRQALLVEPTMAVAQYNLGLALYEQGQVDEAIAAYQQAINLNGSNANAFFNLGLALQQQGRIPEAISAYRQVVKLNPENATTYNNLGGLLAIQGQTVEAVAIYKEAVKRNPNNPEAYHNLGITLYNQGDLKTANRMLARARSQYRERGNFQEVQKIELLLQQIAGKPTQPQVTETPTPAVNSEQPQQETPTQVDIQSNPDVVPASVEEPAIQQETPSQGVTPENPNEVQPTSTEQSSSTSEKPQEVEFTINK